MSTAGVAEGVIGPVVKSHDQCNLLNRIVAQAVDTKLLKDILTGAGDLVCMTRVLK